MLLLAVTLAVSLIAARRPDRLTILVCLTVLALAFYVVPTRVHERYAYPFFALAIILAAVAWRWRVAYVALTVTVFLNMYAALTNPFYDNPGISDWLGIGPALRAEPGVALIALANGAIFLWALAQLRPGARARLAGELAFERELAADEEWQDEPDDGAIPAPAGAAGDGAGDACRRRRRCPRSRRHRRPTVPPLRRARPSPRPRPPSPRWRPGRRARRSTRSASSAGCKARFNETPVRPDRSATLRHEGGGRLDRLDLFLIVLLILGTLLLRTFRLAEPYQMHFDEVYHARTATEFLQSWRYGLSHDIYEWTHPHLAKYAMAAGLVALGQRQGHRHERARRARSSPRPSNRAGSTSSRRAVEPASASTSRPGPRSGPTTS